MIDSVVLLIIIHSSSLIKFIHIVSYLLADCNTSGLFPLTFMRTGAKKVETGG